MIRMWGIISLLALACQTAVAAGLLFLPGNSQKRNCRILRVVVSVTNHQIERQVKEIGLTPSSIYHLQMIARARGLVIVVRERQHAAIQYMEKPNYFPKPPTIKLKSATSGENAGLVVRPEGPIEKWELWQKEEVARLEKAGFTFDPSGVLTGPGGIRFYSDIDLQGIYKKEFGGYGLLDVNAPNLDDVKAYLLPDSIAEAVTHGPNDNFREWNPRLRKDEMLRQPDPDEKFLVVTPDGSAELKENTHDLKLEYQRLHIVWPYGSKY